MTQEDELVAPPGTFAVPGWSRPFSFLARHVKGWNFLLVLPLIALAITAVSLPPVFIYEVCEDDGFNRDARIVACLNKNVALLGLSEILAFLVIAASLVVLSAGFGWTGHRRRRRALRRAYEQRMQRVRDHVITGNVAPEAFDEVQRMWKPLVRGDHPAFRARAGTSTAIVFNVLSSLALGVGLMIYVIGLVDANQDEFLIVWNAIFLPLTIGLSFLVIGGWVVVPRGHAQAVHGTDEAVDALERAEVHVMAGALTARRAKTAIIADGPRFSRYSERTRSD